jgi:Uma2 family endonuclease
MTTLATKQRYTPEDLLSLPDSKQYELVDGELVERNMGWESSWIGGRLYGFMFVYSESINAGWVAPGDASYQCFPGHPNKVRKPDASFIRLARLPAKERPTGHCRIAPDVAAEVVSPNDFYEDVEEKVDEYLKAGVQLVWVVNPATKSVRVHRADGTVTDLNENQELSGEDIMPGFRCRVADLFVVPEEKTAVPGT